MKAPPRLRWRGIEVSEEFQAYAARVSRGEELEPYRGAVLSRPCAEFPWSVASERLSLPSSRPSRSSLAPVSVPLFEAPVSGPAAEAAVYPERGRALKTTLWLAGALSSIIAALGVGAGATSTEDTKFDARAPEPAALALKPEPTAARDEALASSLDVAPEPLGGIGERQLASLAAANEKVIADAKLAAAAPARSPTSRPPAAAPAAVQPPRAVSKPRPIAPPVSAPSASRSTIPAPGPASAGGGLSHVGVVTSARPSERSGRLESNEGDSLFSDRAPF